VPKNTKANNVRVDLTAWGSEKLGKFIADQTTGVLRHLEELRPYYEELWKRFDDLPKGNKILDCSTRTEYCEKILHRSIRSVQFALYGRGPTVQRIDELVEGLQSKQFANAEKQQEHKEWEKKVADQDRREQQNEEKQYNTLKTRLDNLSTKESNFVYFHLTEYDKRGGIFFRSPKKGLTPDELKFVQEYQAKLKQKQYDEEVRRIREQAAREDQGHVGISFDFGGCVLPAPAAVVREFASLGKRQAGLKYHPDRGKDGDAERMVQLNQVANWLEQLAGKKKD
jgi:hypothetical protein